MKVRLISYLMDAPDNTWTDLQKTESCLTNLTLDNEYHLVDGHKIYDDEGKKHSLLYVDFSQDGPADFVLPSGFGLDDEDLLATFIIVGGKYDGGVDSTNDMPARAAYH